MRFLFITLLTAATIATASAAETTIVYDFTSEVARPNAPPRNGRSQTTSTIDGPRFRNVAARSKAVELSDDDGRTTHFGTFEAPPQTPLGPERSNADGKGNLGPISGAIEDEKLTIGSPSPGPTLFGLATQAYDVDYRYTTVVKVALVPINHLDNEEHYTITAADVDVSSAALRVAFSRGYGHALSKHPEAFIGLPLRIEGKLGSLEQSTTVHVEATTLTR